MLSKISEEKRLSEKKIQEKIFQLIDKNESLIFSAGAGAGKTYALVQSLKYIVKKYEKQLKIHNQKIVCITYTNVATQKIKEELGNSGLVKISTIHERIWELIKGYQNELVDIHKIKLEEEIRKISSDLESNKKYAALSDEMKRLFETKMFENRTLFYEQQGGGAAEIRSHFSSLLKETPQILNNIKDFKNIVYSIYRRNSYEKCLKSISVKDKDFTKVKYNVIYNTDRLHKMRISHDTLLEYGEIIIDKFELLQQIIIDKYPYFLVDEYQDTNEKVIQILNKLSKCSLKIKHPFFVGYFGDAVQNIYEDGVGGNISKIHSSSLTKINKEYNRRSCKEIIDVVNEIRSDEIQQVSIYNDSEGGSVKFYTGTRDDIKGFFERYMQVWDISPENKLHCFVLTNKSVAAHSGFGSIFQFFQQTPKYKTALGYQQLTTEVLSDNKSQLGIIPSLLLGIIEFRHKLSNESTLIKELLSEEIYRGMNIRALRGFIHTLQELKQSTLIEFITSLSALYKKEGDNDYKSLLLQLFTYDGFPHRSVESHLLKELYPNIKDEEIEESKDQITDFLNIDLSIFDLWYNYTQGIFSKEIAFHTYHGTKGLEFQNVIILMENAFGRNRNYFKNYFIGLSENRELSSETDQAKNLFYVACSRAIKNLRVLYLDDISDFKAGIEKIFPIIKNYKKDVGL